MFGTDMEALELPEEKLNPNDYREESVDWRFLGFLSEVLWLFQWSYPLR